MKWSYLDTALLVVVSYHLFNAPYTKVEESFNIQAIHDILKYGIWDISKYDHIQFPGVVPRTFIGALCIAFLTNPFIAISKLFSKASSDVATGFETQLLVRSVIGLTNAVGLLCLKNSLQSMFDRYMKSQQKVNGRDSDLTKTFSWVGNWFLLFVMSSFQLMFYASRPLPNFVMTLPLVNVAFGLILNDKLNFGVALLSMTAAIFRLEVAAITVGVIASAYYLKKVQGFQIIRFAAMGASLGTFLSIFIDSHFWGEFTLPEFDAFIYNVISGNSSNWGTEPITAYFTHYLRMLFIPPTILMLNYLGFKFAPDNLKIVGLASYFHIIVMSFQPHKEWRFIVYSIPPIIMLGSAAAAYLWENVKVENMKNILLLCILPLSAIISAVFSLLFARISSMNYPGGEALASFNQYIVDNNITNSTIHISVPPCMTGVTLFGEIESPLYDITYDKTENYTVLENKWNNFDYLLTHINNPEGFPYKTENGKWELIQTTKMFTHMDFTFIRDSLRAFVKNNENIEFGQVLFNNLENIPPFVQKVISTNYAKNVFNEIFEKTFSKSDIFYTYKKVSN
ncbi:dol-P-Man:Man(7)GlcNAc(2)-PP-Dol alpha-1,6-mannosyltransferase [Monosporozyma unispora]|nr:dolichyl-P-Man:Man(7)GlcNAc(2)-PP-dolichol alpha-1,6-mannosyltransferase [Kazachstania unispora]